VSAFTPVAIATCVVAVAVCNALASASPEEEARGLTAVHHYIATQKHWQPKDYRIQAPQREHELLVYEVIYLPDLKPPVFPGGGKSFWAYYDPRRRSIVNVLYGQ
jgi:hypothetical protein